MQLLPNQAKIPSQPIYHREGAKLPNRLDRLVLTFGRSGVPRLRLVPLYRLPCPDAREATGHFREKANIRFLKKQSQNVGYRNPANDQGTYP